MSSKDKSSVFSAEHDLLEEARLSLDDCDSPEELKAALGTVVKAYGKLLRQTEKITKVGDSIQRKLVKAREEIAVKNRRLVRAQRNLIHKEKMLALNTLANGISHEICNPLNFVCNFAALNLQMAERINEHFKEHENEIPQETRELLAEDFEDLLHGAQIIEEQGKRAAAIVDSMSRLTSDRVVSNQSQEVDFNELVKGLTESVVRSFADSHRLNNCEIVYKLQAWDHVKLVIGDAAGVVSQLIKNACEALVAAKEKGPLAPVLKVSTQYIKGRATLIIEDNGEGISSENLEQIFTPFFTTREAASNIGLGLSTCYDILVNGYGGELTLETDVDGFTRARAVWPVS